MNYEQPTPAESIAYAVLSLAGFVFLAFALAEMMM